MTVWGRLEYWLDDAVQMSDMENKVAVFLLIWTCFPVCVTSIYLFQRKSLHRFQKTICNLVIDQSRSHSQLQKKKLYSSRCLYERKKNETEACFNIAKKLFNCTTCNNHNYLNFYVKDDHTENFPRYTWTLSFLFVSCCE